MYKVQGWNYELGSWITFFDGTSEQCETYFNKVKGFTSYRSMRIVEIEEKVIKEWDNEVIK